MGYIMHSSTALKLNSPKTMKRRVSAGCGHRDFPFAERETNGTR